MLPLVCLQGTLSYSSAGLSSAFLCLFFITVQPLSRGSWTTSFLPLLTSEDGWEGGRGAKWRCDLILWGGGESDGLGMSFGTTQT